MIKLTFDGSDERVVANLKLKRGLLQEALAAKLNLLNYLLQQKIVVEKLSGQVLAHRSGKLAGSVRVVEAVPGEVIVGYVTAGGSAAYYGKYHEYGTEQAYTIVPVNKQALAFMMNGKLVIVKSVLHPPIKERSFMRSSLAEMRAQIVSDLQVEAGRVLRSE